MLVSVVVCGYSMDRAESIESCINSVLEQTYDPIEIVIVVDGNANLETFLRERFAQVEHCRLLANNQNRGISYSRTFGAEKAAGEIVAFIDDDAVAEPDWLERLVETYEQTDAIAVGGYVAPNWTTGKPSFFPEEFYWLVGCTEKGFASDGDEVRNTYGSNISYRRDIFLAVGGYDVNTGRKGDRHIQAHEAPVGIRLRKNYGQGMIYNEDAIVHHTLYKYRGEFRWLVARSFWQGFSKRVMEVLYPDSSDNEWSYLRQLYGTYLPHRCKRVIVGDTVSEVQQILAIFTFTIAVACGYGYGLLQNDLLREDSDT